ncbi:hypothetical protein Angca_009232, partial [Angiostrongylus cantonensis]
MLKATPVVLCIVLLKTSQCSGGYKRPFLCGEKIMVDYTREKALDLINRIRSNVALGEFQAKNSMASASDMKKLRWDCNLEAIAASAVENCQPNATQAITENGVNYYYFKPDTSTFIARDPIGPAVLQWTKIENVEWPADNHFNGDPELRDFVNLIQSHSTAVGCFGNWCDNGTSVACVFSQPNVQVQMPVYTSGKPCADCTLPYKGFCESGLCVEYIIPSTTTSPTVTPKTLATTRRIAICSNAATISDRFRTVALRAHNKFRSLVARGLAINGEYLDEKAPPSSRMYRLKYDCTAEQLALDSVRTCSKRLSSPASRPGYDENIHVLGTTTIDSLEVIQNAVATWSSELETNGIPSDMIFTYPVSQRRQKMVLRVTKIIWGTNRNVGCATRNCDGFYFTSCMYREPVNVVGQRIYTIGATCSSCPGVHKNCDPSAGLCSP